VLARLCVNTRQSRAAGEAAGTRTHRQQSSPWPAVTVGGGAPHGSARALDLASRLEAWRRDGQRLLPFVGGHIRELRQLRQKQVPPVAEAS